MNIEQRMVSPFLKAKYLSEPNYRRYTAIINYLYQQHEYYYSPPSLPEDIFSEIYENDTLKIFEDYTQKQMEEDLKQLEEWGNVITHADNARVSKIQDYNRSRLRYQCSEETIEIERMLERLDHQIKQMKGALDSKMIQSLAGLILELQNKDLNSIADKEEREAFHEFWVDMMNRFRTLHEESSDYLGMIQSVHIEEAMQNKEISAFREKFTNYLTDFIIALQENTIVIEYALKDIEEKGTVEKAIRQLVQYQQEKPSLGEDFNDEAVVEMFQKQWTGIKKWFVPDEFGERFVDYLLKQTNETISKFMKYLEQLTEREQQMKSRKHDYLHLAGLFEREANFDHCLQMFGAMTNIERPPHVFSERNKEVYSNETLLEQGVEEHQLHSAKTKGVRRKKQIALIEPDEEAKQLLSELKKQKAYEEEQLDDFTKQGTVFLKELGEVEHFILDAILNWISRANAVPNKKGKADNGVTYHIKKDSDDLVTINTSDGKLTLDDYIIEFEVSR